MVIRRFSVFAHVNSIVICFFLVAKTTSRQQAEMLTIYEKADASERNAVIRQIDSFLEVVPKDVKIFRLKFRYKIERLNESKV